MNKPTVLSCTFWMGTESSRGVALGLQIDVAPTEGADRCRFDRGQIDVAPTEGADRCRSDKGGR